MSDLISHVVSRIDIKGEMTDAKTPLYNMTYLVLLVLNDIKRNHVYMRMHQHSTDPTRPNRVSKGQGTTRPCINIRESVNRHIW